MTDHSTLLQELHRRALIVLGMALAILAGMIASKLTAQISEMERGE